MKRRFSLMGILEEKIKRNAVREARLDNVKPMAMP
jgi:hypothetical protein